MNVQDAYNQWAEQYDSNENKTRDLEAIALRELLAPLAFEQAIELGCGTGKNTAFLLEKAKHITAIDLSEEMLAKAKAKFKSDHIEFLHSDLLHAELKEDHYDLAVFSLVLEHMETLEPVLEHATKALKPGAYLYIGELHPFKQYSGSKARFATSNGEQVVTCFTHHVSDFIKAANNCGLQLIKLKEYFDDNDRSQLPRILSLLFRKN